MLKFDFHVHTCQGDHSEIKIEKAVQILKKKGFDGAVFLDHDAIPRKEKIKDFLIIYGEEVSTSEGHLVGINLKKTIKPLMSSEQTAKEIRKQGGTVILPHPYDYLRIEINRGRLNPELIDAVEVYNGRTLWPWASGKAKEFCEQNKLPEVGCSDAHFYKELGSAYTLVDADPNVKSVLKALKHGKVQAFGSYKPPIIQHFKGGFLKAYNRLFNEKL